MALLAEEALISIEIGSQAPGGGAVTWGAATNIKARATRFEVEDTAEMVNTKALGNTRKRFRGTSGESRVSIGHLVDITGLLYFSGSTMLGLPARVTLLELSGLSPNKQWAGLIQNWKWTGDDAQAQAEDIVIQCDIDATSY